MGWRYGGWLGNGGFGFLAALGMTVSGVTTFGCAIEIEIPAFAGMTKGATGGAGMTKGATGVTEAGTRWIPAFAGMTGG